MRPRVPGVVALLLIACLFCTGAYAAMTAADAPPLTLDHLTTAQGLPQGTVYATLQDSQGFIWLGTEDGLVRYDGHELVRYAYNRSSDSGLPGNFIYQIIEDGNHDLWFALRDAGLARWSRSTDSFTVYRHEAGRKDSLASDALRTLLLDRKGRLWIGMSDAGIDILDPGTGRFEHLRHSSSDATSLSDDRVFTLTEDRSGVIWVGTENGLDRLQPAQRVFTHYRHDESDPHTLSGRQISRIRQDPDGGFWVATYDGGLDHMDADGRVTQALRHDPNKRDSLASDDVRDVLEDQAGHLWIGTTEGLDLLDRTTGHVVHYRHEAGDEASLRDSNIMSLYQDDAGLLWIGTRYGGVSRWNPRSWGLGGHRPAWLAGKAVTSFEDAGGGKVWIGSAGGGLVLFDPATGDKTDLDVLLHKPNALGDNRVMSLETDLHGNLWIGTMAKGLFVLSPAWKLHTIPVKPGDEHGISAAGIMTLFRARTGRIWVGTHGGGANIVDPDSLTVRQLPFKRPEAGALSFPDVSSFAEDPSGRMWIGTSGGGLDLAEADGSLIQVFRHEPTDPRSLPANSVFSIALDRKGTAWIGTDGGGLAHVVAGDAYHPEAIRFKVMTRQEGLPDDAVWGIVPDDGGRLWMSTNAGLVRLDPATDAIKTYHRQHGLQGEEFDFNAYERLHDGRVCFGGPGGFNIFDPAQITDNPQPPRLVLTRIAVMGVPVTTSRPPWSLHKLTLDYRANIVTLDFGALDFTSPERNRIAYRLTGLTDRWIELGNQRRVTLTNLEPGNQVLEVRAANADSVWSRVPLVLTIHRDPAPWRSPEAYAAYVISALALVLYRMYRSRQKFQRVVREQKRLEAIAKALSERIVQVRTLVEALPDKLWVVDSNGKLHWSPTAESLDSHVNVLDFESSSNENPREEAVILAPPDTLPAALEAVGLTAVDGRQRKLEYRDSDLTGIHRSYELRFTRRESGDVVVVRQDTSERTAAAEHIERLAYVDTLTGLPNRQRCIETAQTLFAAARQGGDQVAVIYLDLNNFKRVNDTFGHAVGDEVLRIVAVRLQRILERFKARYRHLSLARFGGDEFLVLMRHVDAGKVVRELAQELCEGFKEAITYRAHEFFSAPSVGIAIFPDHGEDVSTVFKHADTAMYYSKTSSSGLIAIYTPAMSSRMRDWLDLETRLRRAVQEGILQLAFQPKFNLEDNRIVGVEALLRWCDAEHGDISPARFIEIAEDSGLIIDIGSWVVRAVCRYLREWLDKGYRIPVAINVSPKELLHGDPARVVEMETAAAGVPASLIEVEITESLLVKDSNAVQNALTRLRQLGCRIALDDFGTGYSSLSYITRFPPDRIKIDKSFVRDVDTSASDAAIANAILSLSRSLNLTVTAEGVERTGQLEWLRARGCHEVQGFLLARPMSAADLERRFLSQHAEPLVEAFGSSPLV
jgi:diguanylate cyclase (GGDEF)-like protein